jgi:DNA-binding transcriptional LysR family regulator
MPLNLHLLRLFATVARTGSFSRAAEVLHISQPAISKSVRDFELQVGCRLLDRGPQGVKPTREGEALARHAATLFAAERAAEEELQAMRGLHRGSLRIGASTTIATYMIPEYLGAFNRAHPGIELNILSANTQAIADLMIGHEIDIALVEGLVEDRNLVSEPWRTDAMVLIAAPDHCFARAKEPIGLDALAGETLIVREHGSGSLQAVADALQARGIVPARTLEVGGTEAIKQVVAASVGVAIVSAATVKDQVELGKLKIVELRDFSIERTLWQLKKPGRLQSPAASAFEKLIRARESNSRQRPQMSWPNQD